MQEPRNKNHLQSPLGRECKVLLCTVLTTRPTLKRKCRKTDRFPVCAAVGEGKLSAGFLSASKLPCDFGQSLVHLTLNALCLTGVKWAPWYRLGRLRGE